MVVCELVPGRVPHPWTDADLSLVHDACLATVAALTPSPPGTPSLAERWGGDDTITGWFPRLADGAVVLPDGQPLWVAERAEALAALVARAGDVLDGDTACHHDLRADNIVVGERAVLVDWNWLRRGAPWLDFVGLLPPARADGVNADAWLARSPLTRDVDPAEVDCWLATVGAYMLASCEKPLWPGGPPSVRVHQRRFAWLFLDWLAERRGWR